ncbi:peptide chain release factor N(5)-glutamine methyltransferase [Aquifex pyrophilus]
MKVRELLKKVSENKRDARIILSHLLGVKPPELILLEDREVPEEVVEKFNELMEWRREGYPVAYLIGEWECMGRTFKVEEGVLIPRPETEILIEKTLERIPKDRNMVGFELGVGTGCISINLLLERPLLRMEGSDINPKAVKLAMENAKMHRVEKRFKVFLGNGFEPVRGKVYDFIVSNPPYIPEKFWDFLPEEVKREGYSSVIAGKKGYEFYEEIANESPKHLKEKGFVALEIGHDQGDIVRKLFEEKGFKVRIFKDYSGYDRVVIAERWS